MKSSRLNRAVRVKLSGFTLLEVLAAVLIMTILIALAGPSFRSLIQSNKVSSGVNSWLADLRFARSEALRLGGNVAVCRSDDPEAAAPVCSTSAGGGDRGWATGWITFHDRNANGAFDASDTVLRRTSDVTDLHSIAYSGVNEPLTFTATGRLSQPGTSVALRFSAAADSDTSLQRVVCLAAGGRARIAGNGMANCTGDA